MEKIYTPEDIGQIFHLATKTIREWLRQKKLRGIKLGKVWRIPESYLEEYIEKLKDQEFIEKLEFSPIDDEELTDEEIHTIKEGEKAIKENRVHAWEDVRKGL